MRGFRGGSDTVTEPHDLAVVLRQIAEVCDRLAEGDLEARLDEMPDTPEAVAAQNSINRLLDITDAFVRESAASLASASEGRFYRRFLVRGMPGAYRHGAAQINDAGDQMRESADRLAHAAAERQALADDLESTVLQASEQVAAASTELQATASGLVSFAHEATAEAGRAGQTMASLQTTTREIGDAVGLITQVAAQTRLLALNASMEAARAGAAGRGFAVVADEVKQLADRATESSRAIADKVTAVRTAGSDAIAAIEGVTTRIAELDAIVEGIMTAVNGCPGGGAGGDVGGQGGLSHLAEMLRVEVLRFLEAVRGDGAAAGHSG